MCLTGHIFRFSYRYRFMAGTGEGQLPTMEDIRKAMSLIRGRINRTPLDYSETFSRQYSSHIYFKPENLQKTGSFKIRGALVKLGSLTDGEKESGVITASAGNHAQGVASAARTLGINVKIVMPEHTTPAKINAVENYGAEIVLKGKDYNEAREEALRVAEKEKRTFIEGFDDRWIIAGQGTIGMEIMEELPDADQIIVPVGGGGLISGIAIAAKSMNSSVNVIGVQSELCDSFVESLSSGQVTSHVTGTTIADGIAIKYPGKMNLEVAKRYVDRVVTVDEESIALALFRLLERNKILAEPAGAAAFAAILSGKVDVRGKKTVVVISGGNANMLVLSKIIYKSMELEGTLARIGFKIPDRPGTLHRIAEAISGVGANIYHAEVDNLKEDTPVGYQSVTFTVNVRGRKHAELLAAELEKLGWKFDMYTGL